MILNGGNEKLGAYEFLRIVWIFERVDFGTNNNLRD